MTIRTRLTLWYAGILFASTAMIGGISYREVWAERQKSKGEEKNNEEIGHQDEPDDSWDSTTKLAVGCGVSAALLALSGGWILTRKALNPVITLTTAASRLHHANLDEQLPRTGNGDELDRLTQVFNDMTKRLGDSFSRVRDFNLHASHELKTPLTVLHGQLETVLREANLSAGHRDLLLNQLDELQRLSKIVDGLTLLTKAGAGQVTLKMETVRFHELVRDAVADARILSQPRDIEVRFDPTAEITMCGDRHRLRQLLLNLTDNAVKYNKPGGTVDVFLARKDDTAELIITNSGAGIPRNLLPQVFDPFFRGDESHSSTVDGSGLGLSIAKWIVTAHAGTIEITSDSNQPTRVTVRFPIE